jgi:hypothetical protein
MKTETVEIPAAVLSSVETLDELQDWLTAPNPQVLAEYRAWCEASLPEYLGYQRAA